MGVLSIFDREDLKAVYELVMEKYQDEIPEGFDKMLWGDLIIMFNQGDTADFWDEQLNWKIISWKLHSSSGVHTIMTSNGLVIHMLVENRYPLTKEVLSQLLDLKLETEEDSTMALELIKFVKQQLEEFEDSDDDDLAKSDHEEAERSKSKRLLGKDLSNPFMVDNLPKIVWYSMHHSIHTEAWLLQSKRLAGKELSNPFIADDLLKIIWVLPPTTQEEQFADEKERKARTLLLMAVPKDHLRRFHGMDDAKEIWAAIKTRFGGNANSKKMQKAVLKQQFEAFTISSKESLEKGYDRFQKLLSQLDALGAGVSDEDANHKFLRSLPPAWDSLAMTMRTKKNIDTLSIDDLYNNLSVFEQDIQKTSSSSLTSDNGFIGIHLHFHVTPTATPGLADEVIHSFLATNADDVDLIHEDLDQIDDLDLEEMDINWQIAMTAIKIKKFYKKTGRRPRVDGKMHVAFDKRKVECFNCHNTGHFARECKFKGSKEGSRQEAGRGQDFKPVRTEKEALMTIDEGQINWVEQTTDEELNHALMAFTVNNEVSMCSKLCLDSYNALQAKYDELQSEFGDMSCICCH
ncbi:ribonuclease H-like domain-containing protein [Tanacetum coccineum]